MRITDALTSAGVDRLDAEVLLAHVMGHDRTWLIAHAPDELASDVEALFAAAIARRRTGEPLSYITGEKEFYGRTFSVRPGVLIPRPCTEALIDTTFQMLDGKDISPMQTIDNDIVAIAETFGDLDDVKTIVDVGTGSGCIAVTLACERPALKIIAIDVSDDALEVARDNARRHNVSDRITFVHGNLLEPIGDLREPFVLVSNPPYVADESLLGADVKAHEPRIALMGGGEDGADLLRELLLQAKNHPFCRGIVVECLAAQSSLHV